MIEILARMILTIMMQTQLSIEKKNYKTTIIYHLSSITRMKDDLIANSGEKLILDTIEKYYHRRNLLIGK